jgi:acetolactate synthase I/II/III large subunit
VSDQGHGGVAVAAALTALEIDQIFTLSGGHIFPILDGCHQAGIRIVDVRHEATAGFAAEGWARLNRTVGVAAVTAGPGVTNLVSPLTQAGFNGASALVLAGRAPTFRWGQGSLQEIDHINFIDSLAHASTVTDTSQISNAVIAAAKKALSPPRKPAFLDFPLDVLFNVAEVSAPEIQGDAKSTCDQQLVDRVAELLDNAERPVLIAGSNVWLDQAEESLVGLAEKSSLPVYMNGQGRGCMPADHRLAFSRSRSAAFKDADVVIVAGAPLDFRLGFGGNFATGARIVHIESVPELLASHVELAASVSGATLDVSFEAITQAIRRNEHKEWLANLSAIESKKAELAMQELASSVRPIHPLRVYRELIPLLSRDAVVIGDGGDFVSYAGREVPSFEGGRWLDPGPFGCLGCGPGYAMAARLTHPDSQVVLLLGDGALGFSGMELESLVRHKLPVACIVGNNGIWGLEKHPMRALYGYDVAADLTPGLRYDRMMESFGGRGELVEEPEDLAPAFKRALESDEPYLVNVITDPEIAYPRSAILA